MKALNFRHIVWRTPSAMFEPLLRLAYDDRAVLTRRRRLTGLSPADRAYLTLLERLIDELEMEEHYRLTGSLPTGAPVR